jgi:hypothetical protein
MYSLPLPLPLPLKAQSTLIIVALSNLQIKWLQFVLQFPSAEDQALKKKKKGFKLKVCPMVDMSR